MADDFTIEPTYAIQMDEEAQVLQADLGDGYTQRAVQGLNNIKTSWQLVWNGITVANANTLIALFRGRRGASTITWTPKRAVTTTSRVSYGGHHYDCNTTHISDADANLPGTTTTPTYWIHTESTAGATVWAAGIEYYKGSSNEQKWICKKWSRTFESNDYDTVSAVFERVFDL